MFKLLLNGLGKETMYHVVIRSETKVQHSLVMVESWCEIDFWEIIWLSEKPYPEEIGQNPNYQKQFRCKGGKILSEIRKAIVDERGLDYPIYINIAA